MDRLCYYYQYKEQVDDVKKTEEDRKEIDREVRNCIASPQLAPYENRQNNDPRWSLAHSPAPEVKIDATSRQLNDSTENFFSNSGRHLENTIINK